jgi:hypothetical protein
MPINRRIPPPPPPSFGSGVMTTMMSSTPYHAPAAAATNAHKRLQRVRTTSTAATAADSGGSLGMVESEMPSLLPPPPSSLMIPATATGGGGGAPKLMNDEVERFVTIAANTIRAEMRDLSAETKDEMAAHFQVRSSVMGRVGQQATPRMPRPSAVLHSYLYMFLIYLSRRPSSITSFGARGRPRAAAALTTGTAATPTFPTAVWIRTSSVASCSSRCPSSRTSCPSCTACR